MDLFLSLQFRMLFYKTYFQGTAPGTSGLNDQGIWAMIETAETNRVLLTNTFPL